MADPPLPAPDHEVVAGRERRVVSWAVLIFVAACLVLLARAAVAGYSEVEAALGDASPERLVLALAISTGAMTALALLWRVSLRVLGSFRGAGEVVAWYFAGELGKYLPGGVWTLVGRGEIATRQGVDRATAYLSVVVSLWVTAVSGIITVALLSPLLVATVAWAPAVAVPIALAAVASLHPRAMAPVATVARRASGGRLDLQPPPWSDLVHLTLCAMPSWMMVGAASWMVTSALHLDSAPARVAAAAVAAWVVGLLAVPVPSGAGVRELVFVGLAGLEAGPAALVAAVSRFLYLLVDGGGGALAVRQLRAQHPRPPRRVRKTVD